MKLFKTTLVSVLLGGTLFASPFFYTNIDDEFSKFDRYFDSMFNAHFSKHFAPKMEFYNNKENYTVEFEVQGIEKSDLKLSLEEDNILKLEGEKKNPKKDAKGKTNEKYFGSFTRMIQLPDDADSSKITPEHKNGILIVTIGKKERKDKKTTVIEIK